MTRPSYEQTLRDLAAGCRPEVLELARQAEQRARQTRESGEPFELWHSWLPEPSPYLRGLVRRSLGLSPDELSDEGAVILLGQMVQSFTPSQVARPWRDRSPKP